MADSIGIFHVHRKASCIQSSVGIWSGSDYIHVHFGFVYENDSESTFGGGGGYDMETGGYWDQLLGYRCWSARVIDCQTTILA